MHTTVIDRKTSNLVDGKGIKTKPQRTTPKAAGQLCGILSYKDTQGGFDYYNIVGNGCVYVYLLNAQGGAMLAIQRSASAVKWLDSRFLIQLAAIVPTRRCL